MGRAQVRSGRRKAEIEVDGRDAFLTAGDLSRLLEVDLKTVHNWVKQGHIVAYRTEGRHLRFQRVQVVRFLRRTGRPVPKEIGRTPARVLLHCVSEDKGKPLQGAATTRCAGIFPAALEAAAGTYEVMVLELDAHQKTLTRELVGALRQRPTTRALALVGVSRDAARRHEFLACGGDVALTRSQAGLDEAVRWLTGSASKLPQGVQVTAPASERRPIRR